MYVPKPEFYLSSKFCLERYGTQTMKNKLQLYTEGESKFLIFSYSFKKQLRLK